MTCNCGLGFSNLVQIRSKKRTDRMWKPLWPLVSGHRHRGGDFQKVLSLSGYKTVIFHIICTKLHFFFFFTILETPCSFKICLNVVVGVWAQCLLGDCWCKSVRNILPSCLRLSAHSRVDKEIPKAKAGRLLRPGIPAYPEQTYGPAGLTILASPAGSRAPAHTMSHLLHSKSSVEGISVPILQRRTQKPWGASPAKPPSLWERSEDKNLWLVMLPKRFFLAKAPN